jgi:NAD(P)-dependent dehydrogenase (short-subunit alcohol dehydrogenase family)
LSVFVVKSNIVSFTPVAYLDTIEEMSQNIFTLGWTPDKIDQDSLAGQTFLITGATSGTGFETARIFLSKGADVVMLNRSADKSTAAIKQLKDEFGDDANVSFIEMELAKLASVRKAAAAVLQQVPRVSALICNAATGSASQELTSDGFEMSLAVNHFGHFLLCGLLFERLEASSARIVVVSSNGYKWCKAIQFDDLNFDNNYYQTTTYYHSKLAQTMFAYELQRRIKAAGKSVQVYVCHPGASRTQLSANMSWYNRVMWWFASTFAQSAEQGAHPAVMCATALNLTEQAVYGPTQRWDMVGDVGQRQVEQHALDADAAAKLWSVSETKVGYVWKL